MKAHYRAFGGRLVFEVEGETQKALIKAIADLQEVFESESACALCNSEVIRLNVRSVEGNDFYGWVCSACGAELALGQHKIGGTLFVKRTLPNGDLMSDRGWKRYQREANPREKLPNRSR